MNEVEYTRGRYTGRTWNVRGEANARLIAASPELLERLERTNSLLLGVMQFSGLRHDDLAEIQTAYAANRNAITKATGN